MSTKTTPDAPARAYEESGRKRKTILARVEQLQSGS